MDQKYFDEIKHRASGEHQISMLKADKNRISSENIMQQEIIARQLAEIATLKKALELACLRMKEEEAAVYMSPLCLNGLDNLVNDFICQAEQRSDGWKG